jgi:hypothetical protein
MCAIKEFNQAINQSIGIQRRIQAMTKSNRQRNLTGDQMNFVSALTACKPMASIMFAIMSPGVLEKNVVFSDV